MPRLRNAATGVVVNVSDEKAERLGSGWVALDQPAAESKDRTAQNKTRTAQSKSRSAGSSK